MSHSAETLRQRLPRQDLGRLSLSPPQPKKLAEWVAALPMINVGESARQVYVTLQEVNRLQTDERTRFQLLEALRPTVHYLCHALSRHYLNQSVMLPEKATRVATLAQAMQNHLAGGYKLVAIESLDKLSRATRKDPELQKLLGIALHRAICELTGTLLRSAQLYLNTPSRLWLELHSLYLLASEQRLDNIEVKDSSRRHLPGSTIEHAYGRALLIATCKPNKLRQQEIAQVYDLAELWAPMITLRRLGASDELFVFDLLRDAPPTYRNLAKAGDAGELRAIDPQRLVEHLQSLMQNPQLGQPRAQGEASLSATLVQHLIRSWSELTARSFQRMSHDGQLEICLGLTATHYFLADRTDFETLISGGKEKLLISDDDNPFMKVGNYARYREDERGQKDVWSLAYSSSSTRLEPEEDFSFNFNGNAAAQEAEAPEPADLYDRYFCQIVNISPGGYCIEWSGEVPAMAKAGEVIGLREEGQSHWGLGAIRWVRQLPGHGAQLGIEVMAPKAEPCAARVLKKTGDSTEYMRTLLLPEIKALGREATLITPNLTFRSGYKIVIVRHGEEERAQLGRQVSTTQSFSQFEFQSLRKPGDVAPEKAATAPERESDDDFDSIWSSL